MKNRTPNPLVSGTPRERTGSAGIMRRATAEISKRFAGLTRDVLAVFTRIPVYARNDDKGSDTSAPALVHYGATPQVLDQTMIDLQAALDRWIDNGRDVKYVAWWDVYQQEAAQLGTAQTAANLTNLSPAYAAARSLETIVFSEPYRTRAAIARVRSNEYWTGLTSQARAGLAGVIGRAVVDGKNPKSVRTEIMQRLDVSKSRASLYAQTEIPGTLREARIAEGEDAEEQLGIKTKLLWTSAFRPTTRSWHASRSGHTYSREEVAAFYSVNGNRFRCYLPGTLVAGRFVAGAKSRYKGPAVRLVTAGGRELAVTANHPVMTGRGLIAAAEIRKGDNLIAYLGEQKDAVGVVDLNRQLIGARIEDVFGALVDAGHQSLARVSRIDFHGDAAFMQPDIEVVDARRVLAVAMDAPLAKLLDDLSFVHPDSPAARVRALDLLAVRNVSDAGGRIGVGDAGALLGERQLRVSDALGGMRASTLQPGVLQGSHDDATVDAKTLADGEDGFARQMRGMELGGANRMSLPAPGVVAEALTVEGVHQSAVADADAVRNVLESLAGFAAFDEVVDVVWSEYDGHVFDLQELSGLMLGSGIVASNCYCAQTEALLDADGEPILTKYLKDAMTNERRAWQSQQKTK